MGNRLDADLEGKVVVLRAEAYKGGVKARLFRCTGGFGCKPYTTGNAIFGTFLASGQDERVEGFEVERLATDAEVQGGKG